MNRRLIIPQKAEVSKPSSKKVLSALPYVPSMSAAVMCLSAVREGFASCESGARNKWCKYSQRLQDVRTRKKRTLDCDSFDLCRRRESSAAAGQPARDKLKEKRPDETPTNECADDDSGQESAAREGKDGGSHGYAPSYKRTHLPFPLLGSRKWASACMPRSVPLA